MDRAAEYTLEIPTNRRWQESITLGSKDPTDPQAVLEPYNLTGGKAWLQVRATQDPQGDLILDLSTDNGTITLGNGMENIAFDVPFDLLKVIRQPIGYFDLFVQPPGGTIDPELFGMVVFDKAVTVIGGAS